MVKILPLTEEERRSAEIHHDWVYSFLHRHNYNIEEFYAIAVEGFLKGVQDWHRKPGAKEKWGMSIICERAMLDTMYKHFRAENAIKRKPSGGFISLDACYCDDDENNRQTFENAIITESFENDLVCDDAISNILNALTDRQRQIVLMKLDGYKDYEIRDELNIKQFTFNKELHQIKEYFSPLQTGEYIKIEVVTPKATDNHNKTRKTKSKTVCDIEQYIGVSKEILSVIKLSKRQSSVLKLLMVGYKEADIGRELGLQRQAVYDAVKKIRIKASKAR